MPRRRSHSSIARIALQTVTACVVAVACLLPISSAQGAAARPGASATATVPGAPAGVHGSAGNQLVALAWNAPSSNGGSPITGYRVTPYINGAAQRTILTGSTAARYTVTGLTNGTAYTFAIAAINSVGAGPNSGKTLPLTPEPLTGAWTTYRHDAARSGLDPSTTSIPGQFGPAWGPVSLNGAVYGEPLISGGLVVVATEADQVYALNEVTGQIVWHVGVGTPVPAGDLPCGNISPKVGVTSTPVIDPSTGRVFVVAETWNGTSASSIAHKLYALNLANGTRVSGFPVTLDPAGTDHAALLQRSALALAGGKVFAGFGGNYGDCGTYHGWMVGVSATGGTPSTFEVEPTHSGGAIWGAGDGPAVDSAGNLWVETGNGFGTGYGYQESVLRLSQALTLLDHWAPSNWSYLDQNDVDLGSGDPLLLPGGLAFVIGKQGIGYLVSTSSLGGTGGAPVYSKQVCGQTDDASFGGAIYSAGIIYATCSDGLRALALNTASRTFTAVPGWQVHYAALGPPILAGGLVWVTGWNSGQLFGLNPQTGQSTVDQTKLPAMTHFTTPSASDGKLFLATGQAIRAYNIATATG